PRCEPACSCVRLVSEDSPFAPRTGQEKHRRLTLPHGRHIVPFSRPLSAFWGASMQRILSLFAFAAVLAACAATARGKADDDFKLEDGFVSLFNGKDLTGWEYKGSKENLEGKTATADERVKVENGVIVMME